MILRRWLPTHGAIISFGCDGTVIPKYSLTFSFSLIITVTVRASQGSLPPAKPVPVLELYPGGRHVGLCLNESDLTLVRLAFRRTHVHILKPRVTESFPGVHGHCFSQWPTLRVFDMRRVVIPHG